MRNDFLNPRKIEILKLFRWEFRRNLIRLVQFQKICKSLRQSLIQKSIRTHDKTPSTRAASLTFIDGETLWRNFEREPRMDNLPPVHAALRELCILMHKYYTDWIDHYELFSNSKHLHLNSLNIIWGEFPKIRTDIQQILQETSKILWKFVKKGETSLFHPPPPPPPRYQT